MANRTLLCVEPDDGTVDVIRGALQPYGFDVENISNGEAAIEWARRNDPALIIVSVEPRKVGYAVCNKLKRSNELQHIPLILTSGEETPQTFEQHKKLKSRADEYILKPFPPEELVSKVGTLVRLEEPRSNGGEPEYALDSPISQELSVGDSDIVNVNAGQAPSPFGNGAVDSAFDRETDAAFAALEHANDITGPVSGLDLSTNSSDWDDEKTRTTMVPDEAALETPPSIPSAAHLAFYAHEEQAIPPDPDEVSVTAALHDPSFDNRLAELNGLIGSLEADKRALQEQLEEAKLRLQSQPLSREKEFLSLREVINRKDKDLLDLRDALDAKDRAMLDHKDRVRESERGRRDLEEKMLAVEKSLMATQERMSALAHDKEKSLEREKGMKSRLDDALTEIQKAHDEADSHKRRLGQQEEKSKTELEKVRGELEARMAELEEGHRGEVARLSDARVQVEEELKSEYEGELSRQKSAHAAELEAIQKRVTEERNALEERLQGEIARMRKEHDKALAAGKEEQAVQLAAERQAHQESTEAKEQNHKNEILGLRRRAEEELTAAEERRQREATDAETRRLADLDAAEQRRRVELQSREEEHHGKLTEMDRLHFTEKTELGERHRQELDQSHGRAARAEGELAARSEELAETQRRLTAVSADRDGLRADLRDREVKLGQLRDRSAELEAKSAEYEDQILRAYQKLRADEKVVERAKRALAVALSLLDERAGGGNAGVPTASSPSTGSGGHPAVRPEESGSNG